MPDKQEWIYTDDGPVIDDKKPTRVPKTRLKKIYFVLPWIGLAIVIIWSFLQGGAAGITGGILLIVMGPAITILINILTFYFLAIRPLKKMVQNSGAGPKIQR